MGTAIRAAGPDHAEYAAVEIFGKLLATEPPSGWI